MKVRIQTLLRKKGSKYDPIEESKKAQQNLRKEFNKYKRHEVELSDKSQLVGWSTFIDGGGIGFQEQKGIPRQLIEAILVKRDGDVFAVAIADDISPGFTTLEGGLQKTTGKDPAGIIEQVERGETIPVSDQNKLQEKVVVIPLKSDQALDAINRPIQNQDKLFMPASEAGAGKGKQAEAAKLWNKDGVKSPYFKKWFGKSKVVDENGEPLVVYRGDRPGKEVFTGRENPYNLIQGNVFFSDNAEVAKFYTDQRTNYLISPEQMNEADGLYGTYLRLKKPLEVDAKENSWTDIPDPFDKGTIQIDDLGEIAQKKGYDGMIIKNVYDQGGFGTQYIAFSPEQIKSATGNRGTFDAGERNINYMPSDSKAPSAKPANRITRQAPAMPAIVSCYLR